VVCEFMKFYFFNTEIFPTMHHQKIKYNEFLSYYFLFLSFAFFIHLIAIFLPEGIVESEETKIYVIFFGVIPFAIYLFYKLTDRSSSPEISLLNHGFFFVNGFLVILFALYHLCIVFTTKDYTSFYVYCFSALQIGLSASLFVLIFTRARINIRGIGTFLGIANQILIIITPLVLFALFLTNYQLLLWVKLSNNLNYQMGAIIGFVAYLIVLTSPYVLKKVGQYTRFCKIISILCSVFAFFIIISLFDPSLSHDPHHYNSYTGPAMATLGGWLPMVDIHTHYGFLPYLLVAFLYQFIPPSYEGMTLLVALANVLQLLVVFLILKKVIQNKILLYVGGILAILYYQIHIGNNSIAFPSTSGYRHLPTFLLLCSLIYLPLAKKFHFMSVLALIFCSFWSVDQLFFGTILYWAFLVAESWAKRESILNILISLVIVVLIVIISHVLYSIGMFVSTGYWPRYDLAIETVMSFFVVGWAYPINIDILLFGFHALAYSLVLSYSLYVFFMRDTEEREQQWHVMKYYFLIAIIGICHCQYFVGRSSEIALKYYSIPLGILFLCLIDRTFVMKGFYYFKVPIIILLLIILPLLTGSIVEYFVVPGSFQYSEQQGFSFDESNGSFRRVHSVLRRMLSSKNTLRNVLNDVKQGVLEPDYPRWIGSSPFKVEEAVKLIRKWQPEEDRLLLFMTGDFGVSSLMYSNKAYKYPIGFATIDSLHPKKTAKVLNTEIELKKGDILITDCLLGIDLKNIGSTLFKDACQKDKTKEWRFEGESLNFKKDHYELRSTDAGKHMYRTNMSFAKGVSYEGMIDIRNGSAENSMFAIYINDGKYNLYSAKVATSDQWATHRFKFESKMSTTNGFMGVAIFSPLAGKTINVKNITLKLFEKEKQSEPIPCQWCTLQSFDNIQAALLRDLISKVGCKMVDESVSGVKVFRLQSGID
jgi:hypothetical protein